ncbi:MAG: DUF87 domain-containing protein [Candidatus Marinimicrobia bacterium]|nr:DUF87 domain-containing protein [Candidatus Neomarinimicrobiota bacterium]
MNSQIIEKLTLLEQMAREADLLEVPMVRSTLIRLSLNWNDVVANQFYGYLLNQVDGSFFTDDVFKLPRSQEELSGELVLGNVLGRERIELRHKVDRLPMHILIVGSSGSGKTNLAKVIIERVLCGESNR